MQSEAKDGKIFIKAQIKIRAFLEMMCLVYTGGWNGAKLAEVV